MSEAGRNLYSFRKEVGITATKTVTVFTKYPRLHSKLRTGYCLNEYMHKIGVADSPQCRCGAVETVEHYIEECPEIDNLREELRVKLMQQAGLNLWSGDLFLTIKRVDEFKEERIIIQDIFEEFLTRSGRLMKSSA